MSCTSEGCYKETDADLIVSLRETVTEIITAQDSITIYGVGMEDSTIYNNANILTANLPLDATGGYSEFVVINGLIADTISLWYSSNISFISKACGYSYIHTIESLKFTRHKIDTILIINESVTTNDEENIRTFF